MAKITKQNPPATRTVIVDELTSDGTYKKAPRTYQIKNETEDLGAMMDEFGRKRLEQQGIHSRADYFGSGNQSGRVADVIGNDIINLIKPKKNQGISTTAEQDTLGIFTGGL